MRRISIDTSKVMPSQKSRPFDTAKTRRSWCSSRPRLLTTCLFFGALWLWFKLPHQDNLIPEDSFEYLEDESLQDIRNETLGFEKILVLNLPFRTDRRDAISLSAALSNIKLEFVNGVTGDSIHEKAYPPPDENIKLLPGIRGSWRTHMNALQRVVEQNLTTALILEDDVDWDIRIRQSLQRFALASRFLSDQHTHLTPHFAQQIQHTANTETKETAYRILDTSNLAKTLSFLPLSSTHTHSSPYTSHPYANPLTFDILWLGHCGAGMPRPPLTSNPNNSYPNPLLLTHHPDPTVPAPQHLKAHPFQDTPDPLATLFAPHTRVYHPSTGGSLCTVAYAVSQRGARRLLHQFGVKAWNGIFDAELGRWCAGLDPQFGRPRTSRVGEGAKERLCITTQPPLFAHHHPRKGESDIGGLGGGYARAYETKYLRYSVRINMEGLVEGVGEKGMVDQWVDGEGREG
ncbi:hypothetical protein LEMA_P051540.1 [Plenodomus lingam JN3]|uniref:Glycosyl transferase family 25 domain-containing protein n=2 Tax=Leptosphaeria maculans TaxID=5022 RepID=E4ZM99_LEPMJ|nr:hypothetical protein LEMA_P051540.1 [Plenodomus lingam JN3]CBX92448.1 hypothetical protein LEMA_P051540.1 [Plenodomus lingam JN3]